MILIRCDRINRKGGGVLVFYRRNFQIEIVSVSKNLELQETIIFDLILNTQKIRFLLVYRSPSYDELYNDKLC